MPLRSPARAALACLVLAGSVPCAQAETASWYGSGRRTANGEHFVPDGLTAAHRTLPFGTLVRVTYGGRSVVVRINDRGPFIAGRAIDLSRGAARAIGLSGVGRVHLAILG
ncbi:rare lipoprotein A [Methylobacterium sp. OAE515]|uniref:septal ring lytic transglycosylase RlpA family protein n=1 Tax=Methylobacterium sp. OAE515 TaxID=2817895 RepID=UPI00178B45CE